MIKPLLICCALAGLVMTGTAHSQEAPPSSAQAKAVETLVIKAAALIEKDGKTIPFRKASLTRDAESVDEDTPFELSIRETALVTEKKRRRKKVTAAAKKAAKKNVREPLSEAATDAGAQAHHSKTELMLREWRREQAKKLGVPAFRIISDRVLMAIAQNQPRSAAELLAIPGIGIATVEKYGAQLYRILNQSR